MYVSVYSYHTPVLRLKGFDDLDEEAQKEMLAEIEAEAS